ncbi:hypothetical protein [Mycobacteroides abscessus]|uniref:hypothetical protein n=1 Tax=Mycobacteroides abscessus TaxID=36809 RepID=UPI0012FFDC9F|nr:hypothetical protein [Mycobacteroides abscessus]
MAAIDRPPEPRDSQPTYRGGPSGALSGLAGDATAHDLIAHLCHQIAGLRQLAAQHSPGEPSAQLHRDQTQQLIAVLETHRSELRALLGGGPI